MVKALLLGLALAGTGCGVEGLQSVKGKKVYVDGVPADAVAAALDMWNTAVGTDLAITDDPRISDATVVSVTEDCGGHTGWEDTGTTQAAVCMNYFKDDLSNPLLAVVIAHELGHVMGMHHIPVDTAALMNHAPGPDATITDADVAQFRARWGTP